MRFVLIDELLELEPGRRARARTTFPPTDPLFADHFPGLPIVPGVLITEAIAQTGGWLLAFTLGFSRWPVLTIIDRAKFRQLVSPGDELEIVVEVRSRHQDDFEITGEARVKGARVADATLRFHTFDFALADSSLQHFATWTRATFQRLGGEALVEKPPAPSPEAS